MTYQEHIAEIRRLAYSPQLVALHVRFGVVPNETCGGCYHLTRMGGTGFSGYCAQAAVQAPWRESWPACGRFMAGEGKGMQSRTEEPPSTEPFEEVE